MKFEISSCEFRRTSVPTLSDTRLSKFTQVSQQPRPQLPQSLSFYANSVPLQVRRMRERGIVRSTIAV